MEVQVLCLQDDSGSTAREGGHRMEKGQGPIKGVSVGGIAIGK